MWSTHFPQDASTTLATQFMQESRVLLAPGTQPSTAGSAITRPLPAEGAGDGAFGKFDRCPLPSLSFKATLLDEKEPDARKRRARVRVRVDVVNTGAQTVQDSAVRLTGPQALLVQFPATTLAAARSHQADPGRWNSLRPCLQCRLFSRRSFKLPS